MSDKDIFSLLLRNGYFHFFTLRLLPDPRKTVFTPLPKLLTPSAPDPVIPPSPKTISTSPYIPPRSSGVRTPTIDHPFLLKRYVAYTCSKLSVFPFLHKDIILDR